MAVKDEKLIEMANQIAAFFHPYPAAEGAAGIQDHLQNFWTPQMRSAIQARAAKGDDRIDPLVVEAVRRFQPAASPIRKQTAGPGQVGELASDAG